MKERFSTVRVMSYNLRMNTPKDGEYAWPKRAQAVQTVWSDVNADVVGIQEGLPHQVTNLSDWFPEYGVVGIGREADGTGERVAIFYKRDKYTVLEHGDFWLSDTPDVPGSRSYGNYIPRISTWARLQDKQGRIWFVLNTHLDHASEEARVQGSAQIKSFLEENTNDEPIVVTGDFNALPNSIAMQHLLADGGLIDVLAGKGETGGTFHGYSEQPGNRIDYILTSTGVAAESGVVVRDRPDGVYPSDHYPIYADLR